MAASSHDADAARLGPAQSLERAGGRAVLEIRGGEDDVRPHQPLARRCPGRLEQLLGDGLLRYTPLRVDCSAE